MIKAGVIGATGYAGNELVRLLMQHPEVELKTLLKDILEKNLMRYMKTIERLTL